MQQHSNSNAVTVPWQQGVDLGGNRPPEYLMKQKDINTFQTDGVVILRGVFVDWVDRLIRGLQRNLDDPQSYAFPCESNPTGEPGRFFDSYCNWQLIPEYLEFVSKSCAASIAGQCTRSESVQFFHEHAFMKTAGTQQATPWHQDLPYYCVDGTKSASVYVSLDTAAADVAVRFVKGSHRWGRLYLPRVFEDGSNLHAQGELETVPDIDANPKLYDIVAWALEPGDAVIFDFRTLHGTTDAEIKTMRRAFSTRWMGDDITYCEREGETSPPYTDHAMLHGDKMREDWFPTLWERES